MSEEQEYQSWPISAVWGADDDELDSRILALEDDLKELQDGLDD